MPYDPADHRLPMHLRPKPPKAPFWHRPLRIAGWLILAALALEVYGAIRHTTVGYFLFGGDGADPPMEYHR